MYRPDFFFNWDDNPDKLDNFNLFQLSFAYSPLNNFLKQIITKLQKNQSEIETLRFELEEKKRLDNEKEKERRKSEEAKIISEEPTLDERLREDVRALSEKMERAEKKLVNHDFTLTNVKDVVDSFTKRIDVISDVVSIDKQTNKPTTLTLKEVQQNMIELHERVTTIEQQLDFTWTDVEDLLPAKSDNKTTHLSVILSKLKGMAKEADAKAQQAGDKTDQLRVTVDKAKRPRAGSVNKRETEQIDPFEKSEAPNHDDDDLQRLEEAVNDAHLKIELLAKRMDVMKPGSSAGIVTGGSTSSTTVRGDVSGRRTPTSKVVTPIRTVKKKPEDKNPITTPSPIPTGKGDRTEKTDKKSKSKPTSPDLSSTVDMLSNVKDAGNQYNNDLMNEILARLEPLEAAVQELQVTVFVEPDINTSSITNNYMSLDSGRSTPFHTRGISLPSITEKDKGTTGSTSLIAGNPSFAEDVSKKQEDKIDLNLTLNTQNPSSEILDTSIDHHPDEELDLQKLRMILDEKADRKGQEMLSKQVQGILNQIRAMQREMSKKPNRDEVPTLQQVADLENTIVKKADRKELQDMMIKLSTSSSNTGGSNSTVVPSLNIQAKISALDESDTQDLKLKDILVQHSSQIAQLFKQKADKADLFTEMSEKAEQIEKLEQAKADANIVARKAEREYVDSALEKMRHDFEAHVQLTNMGTSDAVAKDLDILKNMIDQKTARTEFKNLREVVIKLIKDEKNNAEGLAGRKAYKCLSCNRSINNMRVSPYELNFTSFVSHLPNPKARLYPRKLLINDPLSNIKIPGRVSPAPGTAQPITAVSTEVPVSRGTSDNSTTFVTSNEQFTGDHGDAKHEDFGASQEESPTLNSTMKSTTTVGASQKGKQTKLPKL